MILIVSLIALFLVSPVQKEAGAVDETGKVCIKDRAALLAKDQDAFDQDLKGGWRTISYRKGCEIAAAELLRDYRQAHPKAVMDSLYWHEGQVRAFIGHYEEAIALFKKSYTPQSNKDWSYYAKATIAFLENDRNSLEKAYEGLRTLPLPDNWQEITAAFKKKFGATMQWPMNIGVVEALRDCFGKPYKEAYFKCNKATFKVTTPDPPEKD